MSKNELVNFDDAIREYRWIRDNEPQRLMMRINPQYYATSHRKQYPDGVCQTCGDAGFIRLSFPIGHPYFGKPIRCPRCNGG